MTAKDFCKRIVKDKEYRENLMKRAKAGILPSPIEALVWAYAEGKPISSTEHRYPDGVKLNLASLTNDQLSEKIEELTKEVREMALPSLQKESDGKRDGDPRILN